MHTWSSLVCTLFLLLLCVTGLPLIFQDEIADALGTPSSALVPAGTPAWSLDRLVDEARSRYPGDGINFLSLPDDDPGMATIGMIDRQGGYHWLKYDRHTGALLDDQLQEGHRRITFMDVVLAIHQGLTLGLPGTLFLGMMGLLFLVSLVSGTVLYAPFVPREGAGAMRLRGSARVRWLDLHNVLGIVVLAWMAVVGATGVINTLEKPLFALWQSTQVERMVAGRGGTAAVLHGISVQSAADTALRTWPHQQIASILFPSEARHHPHHYLVWMHGDTPVTRETLTPVWIDATTGAREAAPRLPWYLVALEVSRPLHFGDYGGLPLKLLWLVFDLAAIAVLVSGLYLWQKRRRAPLRESLV